MNNLADQLSNEIFLILDAINDITSEISLKTPVSHKSQARIQWYGGIPGAIKDIRESKRLEKLINEPIVKDISFWDMSFFIINKTELLVSKQLELQKILSDSDPRFYGIVIDIYNLIKNLTSAWYNYSPDMATELMKSGDLKNISLLELVQHCTKTEILKLKLPEKLQFLKITNDDSNSGCFSILIAFFIVTSSLIGIIGYGVYQLII